MSNAIVGEPLSLPGDDDDETTFSLNESGRLCVFVWDVNSGDNAFTTLSPENAILLRDWLLERFPQ